MYGIHRTTTSSSVAKATILSTFWAIVILMAPALLKGQTPRTDPGPMPGETLVWSDEFNGKLVPSAPDTTTWAYITGKGESGGEQIYCKYNSSQPPCDPKQPNSYVGSDGNLHITVWKTPYGGYTSAFLQTKKLKSFQYGRVEARIKLPSGQGMWPAFWMMGDSVSQVSWPKCGEIDILENLGRQPSRVYGTLHAAGYAGAGHGKTYDLPGGKALANDFHIYGMIWTPKKIQLYFDLPSNIYATFTQAELPAGQEWPFDTGKFYILLNTAVGGSWGGAPDATTKTPADMLVDYVRVYQTAAEATN
jgi:Glycosyl hydrolases family 16